jgi:hypothetical protein
MQERKKQKEKDKWFDSITKPPVLRRRVEFNLPTDEELDIMLGPEDYH